MRIFAKVALLTALSGLPLSGCMSGDNQLAALDLSSSQDDAHCRSLLMQPGELVYAQCRLALRKTYLNDYATRKAPLTAKYGPLSETLDQALRADAFCNYDESVKASVNPQDEQTIAQTAYSTCQTTRDRLQQEFAQSTGADPAALVAYEQPTIISQNVDAVREARDVIRGPIS